MKIKGLSPYGALGLSSEVEMIGFRLINLNSNHQESLDYESGSQFNRMILELPMLPI